VLLGDELSAALDAPRSDTPHLHCPPPSISPPPNQSIIHSIHEKLAMAPLIIGSSYSLALELQLYYTVQTKSCEKKTREETTTLRLSSCSSLWRMWGGSFGRGRRLLAVPAAPKPSPSLSLAAFVHGLQRGGFIIPGTHGWCLLVPYFRLHRFPPSFSLPSKTN
jgi:hypothetical protein